MPEIGEVARIVARLRTHLVGKRIENVQVTEDNIVYHKDSTTAQAFKKAMDGNKVVAAKQWGKYFWLVMETPPHPLMHFGMTGWIYIKSDPGAHYRASELTPAVEWPPKFSKFNFQLEETDNEIAFTDSRRLARIRLINHHDGHDLRNLSPLKENGPDPVLDKIELAWLSEQMKRRKVPIKAYLLDQSAIAGVGNWVGDEILYHARIHPETYTNTLSDLQISAVHKALLFVTKLAVDLEADSSKFPENWLMLHRWGKGKRKTRDGKVLNRLPTGEKIEFVTVGGRTSAYVPALQKKSGVTAKEQPVKRKTSKEKSEDGEDEEMISEDEKPIPKRKPNKSIKFESDTQDPIEEKPPVKRGRGRPHKIVKVEEIPEKMEPEVTAENRTRLRPRKALETEIEEQPSSVEKPLRRPRKAHKAETEVKTEKVPEPVLPTKINHGRSWKPEPEPQPMPKLQKRSRGRQAKVKEESEDEWYGSVII
ncbi:hypothetical protein RUND412_005025 [Rhizina undulata]